jgi:hypothetical protein
MDQAIRTHLNTGLRRLGKDLLKLMIIDIWDRYLYNSFSIGVYSLIAKDGNK